MSSTTEISKAVSSVEEKISIVGVDLAKDKFDTYYEGKSRTYPYNNLGLSRFRSFLSKLHGRVVVAFESTGYISRPFTRVLIEMGVEWRCVPPFFVRSYATAMGIKAKTDPIDAKVIVQYAQARPVMKCEKTSKLQLDLQELEALKQLCIRALAHFKTAKAAYTLPFAELILCAITTMLDEQINKLMQEMDDLISADAELAARRDLYMKEAGIGKKIAQTLVCTLPELGSCSGKEIAALVGLAPYDHSSGNMSAPKHIRGGRKNVRAAMYMAGIAIRRCKKGAVKDFYLRLKAEGKPQKLIAIACARKILTRLNAAARCMQQQTASAA